jgi:hypothetical protein
MVRFANTLHGQTYDATQTRLREILTDLEGVSEETLEQIEHISRPTGDGPAPHDEGVVVLYERLVLLALAEATASLGASLGASLARQAKPAKAKK